MVSIDVSARPIIRFTGPDRAKSLHNLTTQDIQALAEGQVSETFVTSPQGKVLGFFAVRKSADAIDLSCEPGGEAMALEHFAKYTIFDDVAFEVVTAKCRQRLWLGAEAVKAVTNRFPASGALDPGHFVTVDDPELGRLELIRPATLTVPAIHAVMGVDASDEIDSQIAASAGVRIEQGDESLYERLRVLSALPKFPVEIRADNLPQEIDRDATAISFRKGCYLGQETVARLDALGHVNRILRGFVIDSDHVPVDPAGLFERRLVDAAGQPVGEIRSAVSGENPNQAVGMALIRTKALEGVIRTEDLPDSNLTLLTPTEFRERFAPLASSLIQR